MKAEIGIIGGSGLYDLVGLEDPTEFRPDTPFGKPSDALQVGTVDGRRVAFLARHGANHELLPSEINYRANVFAMKLLGVERILSASAVGSMRESIHPREVVVIDQFIDRTAHRRATFFGEGIVAHISFAHPICPELRRALVRAARDENADYHDGGTYVCMEGPAFSTRAESELYRSWGVHVIGMTNLQEAKLAREAEICYATLALVTDYDCWHEDEGAVSVAALIDNLEANARLAAHMLRRTLSNIASERLACDCGDALRHAILTRLDRAPERSVRRLRPILARYLDAGEPSPDP